MKRKIILLLSGILCFSMLLQISALAQSVSVLLQGTTIAGSGEFGSSNGAAVSTKFRTPQGLAILKDGSLLVADTRNHLIRQVKNGQVSTFAGITFDENDLGLPLGGLANGKVEQSVFKNPADIEADAFGNLYVADSGNNVIRKIDTRGNVTILAGDPDGVPGSDDGRGEKAKFNFPADLAVTAGGVVYVADTLNHTIRKITTIGQVSTLNTISARTAEVFDGQVELAGDFRDGKLSEALFNEPSGLTLDAKGNLFVSDSGNQRIRYIDLTAGTVTTVAGAKQALPAKNALYATGDYADGAADDAKFDFPKGLALTAEGGLLIADSLNNAIRYFHNDKVTTLIGDKNATFGDAEGTEKTARLHHPTDVAIAANGDIYIADSYNNKIRKISNYQLPAALKKDGNIHVVNGSTEIVFDAKPQNIQYRVVVPVRAIAESLGYEVKSSDNAKIVLAKGTVTIEFSIGGLNVKKTVGTETFTSKIETAPFIKDDHAYVPVRFISEQLGKQVDWNQEYKTVIIR